MHQARTFVIVEGFALALVAVLGPGEPRVGGRYIAADSPLQVRWGSNIALPDLTYASLIEKLRWRARQLPQISQ